MPVESSKALGTIDDLRYRHTTHRSLCAAKKDDTYAFLMYANTGWRDGYYSLPAEKVEKQGSALEGAIREAWEEVGISVQASDLVYALTSHRFEDGTDWVDVVFVADTWQGEVINNEPHVHSELIWLALEKLPENVTPSQRFMLEQIKLGKSYCDFGWNT